MRPVLCAPESCNAQGLMGALDMGGLRIGHFCDDPKEWELSLLRCDSAVYLDGKQYSPRNENWGVFENPDLGD